MNTANRFFIIHADGDTSTVSAGELAKMRESGMIAPDDKVIPLTTKDFVGTAEQVAAEKADSLARRPPPPAVAHAMEAARFEDLETQPISSSLDSALAQKAKSVFLAAEGDLSNLADEEIEGAFSHAESQKIYTMEAQSPQIEGADSQGGAAATISNPRNQRAENTAGEFQVKFSDGRIQGPFTAAEIEARIRKGVLAGGEQFREGHQSPFRPLRQSIQFLPILKVFRDSERPPVAGKIIIGRAGVLGALLGLQKANSTGWVTFVLGHQVKVLALRKGQLLNLFSNVSGSEPEDELNELLGWDGGIAWQEADPVAGTAAKAFSISMLQLAKKSLFSEASVFGEARQLHALGDMVNHLSTRSARHHQISSSELTEFENSLIRRSLEHPTVLDLIEASTQEKSRRFVVSTLYFLMSAGFLKTVKPEEAARMDAMYSILLSEDWPGLFPIDDSASDQEKGRIFEEIRRQIARDIRPLAKEHPKRIEVENTLKRIEPLLMGKEAQTNFGQTEESSDAREPAILAATRKIAPIPQERISTPPEAPYPNTPLAAPRAHQSPAGLAWNLTIALLVISSLWILSVDLALGKEELSDKIDAFLWIRPAVLLFGTALGFGVFFHKGPSAFLKGFWNIQGLGYFLATALGGGLVGFFANQYFFDMRTVSTGVLSLLALNLICDRIFFAGYLGRAFGTLFSGRIKGTVLISVLYAAYFLTYYSIFSLEFGAMSLALAFIWILISLPMAFLQQHFQSAGLTVVYLLSLLIFAFVGSHLGISLIHL